MPNLMESELKEQSILSFSNSTPVYLSKDLILLPLSST